MHDPSNPLWLHDQHVQHRARRRSGGGPPSSPASIVLFVLVAIVAFVVFANVSSRADDVFPGAPSSELFDGGTGDLPPDLPTSP
ncbi:hypothetical protein [Arthrobacter sp. NEB 688]|uniref:hypothetical protein n=1 Tax=Arthrobacter sp. NEB 688 TaxID=904039 RepID=UPI0015667769|nr:hypothetical protein [Arthrobacter sp. NEB 688]QKE84746.1 hypothetical protein HL663_12910 [Arthrobacter sp. NEB 688]